jgi:hypothetical protein
VIGRIALLALAGLGWAGCGAEERCARAEAPLVEGGELTCAEAEGAVRYGEALSARRLTPGQRRALLDELASRDAAEVSERLAAAEAFLAALRAGPPDVAAKARAREAWAITSEGERGSSAIFAPSAWPGVSGAIASSVAVWARDDAAQAVLTEMDVEGVLRLVSLCREVQGGTPIRLSIADRVAVYKKVVARFEAADTATRDAMVQVGPFWQAIRDAWKAAGYDVQQGWIQSAPLPPPMTGNSAEYVDAVLAQDVARLVGSMHVALGPLPLRPAGGP